MTVLYTRKEIEKRIEEIALELSTQHDDLIIIGVLNGPFMFLSDLTKELNIPCQIDFIRVKTYANNESTGKVKWIKHPEIDLTDKDVLIIEDILETGLTLKTIKEELQKQKPRSIKTAVLLQRESCPIAADYVGFTISKADYVIGYGLDDNERCRNYPFIYIK